MEYIEDEKRLEIDCREESFRPELLLAHSDVQAIRIDNVTGKLELPAELADFENLNTLHITGGDRERNYPPPTNLDRLVRLKELTLWSFCDLSALPPLPHIESFDVVVRNPLADVPLIVRSMPNLRKMELWGSHLKSGELPAEFAELARLEELELVSCGLVDLPAEFARLTALRRLRMRGLPMNAFPDVICELAGLEELEFKQSIVSLPESFAKLRSLRKLNFDRAFNKGTMSPVNKWGGAKVYLHPIPEVIGALPQLEDLDLSMCGLADLAFLKNAAGLKRFRAQYSALEDCRAFAGCSSLEELDLESGEVLKSLEGIAGLPIERLKLADCDDLSDLSPILELPRLKLLNIERCDDIESLDPAYQHPTLETLEASDEVLEQWHMREQFANLRPVEEVVATFERVAAAPGDADALAGFEAAVADLALHVDKNYHDENNPLAGYFGQEADNYEIVELPALEAAFEAHGAVASQKTLLSLARLSLRSLTEDNYEITLQVVREINRRSDAQAQTEFVRIFEAACEYYDFGHRFMESTVHDQLHDDIFPEFASGALIELLRDGHGDMLNSDGGDQADLLFEPAFRKIENEAEFEELLRIFFEYQDENIEYHGAEYFGALHESIRNALSGEYLTRFQVAVRERSEQIAVLELIESETVEDKIRLIEILPELDSKFITGNAYKILRPLTADVDLPRESAIRALDFFIRREDDSGDVADLIVKTILETDGVDAVIEYLRPLVANSSEERREYMADVVCKIIESLILAHVSEERIQPLRDFLIEFEGIGLNALRAFELKLIYKLLEDHSRHASVNTPEKMEAIFERLERTAAAVGAAGERINLHGWDFGFELYLLASHADHETWKIIKRVCTALFPVLSEKFMHSVLHISIVAAAKTEDEEHFDRMLVYVPEKITVELLAYNLACVSATFQRKDAMLKYIARSLALGKTTEQFLDDPDFAPYLEDEDFRQALAH